MDKKTEAVKKQIVKQIETMDEVELKKVLDFLYAMEKQTEREGGD